MKAVGSILAGLLLASSAGVVARGVTPYLPLNLEPEMESQIERVLILAGKPVTRRPIAAATVLDALPKACELDQPLCERVRRYLARYTGKSNLTHASVEGAATSGADTTLPNRYGMGNRSAWAASADVYLQPSDYFLINAGVVAYDGRENPTGSVASLGFSFAQLDLGYRPHWFSPMSDSSMLMSSQAPTTPSATLSNYEPFTSLGLGYEMFITRMTKSDHILFQDGDRSGYPHLFGLHLSMEPASGWSLAVNRLLQYGGARRPGSFKDLVRGFFDPSKYDNVSSANLDRGFGNQEASVTSSFMFPGRMPFAVYAEYAGEDTSRGRNDLLGNAALSWGIHFPRVARRFDLTLELSEWQNAWYVHETYQDGMTNYGHVTGAWFGDERVFGDGVGGRSAMARLGWDPWFGGLVELRYRTVENQVYGVIPYQRYHEISVGYSRPWGGVVVGGELDSGSDVFGKSFSRVASFVRFDDPNSSGDAWLVDSEGGDGGDGGTDTSGQLFVDAGVNALRVRTQLTELSTRTTGPRMTSAHLAFGARRSVSDHSDLGARVDLDDLGGHSLAGVRLIDYRYRFNGPLAVLGFLGAARYALATPAYSFYYGAGLQWRDVLPHLDAGVEARYYDSVARDRLLPSDPHTKLPDSFYDIWGAVFSLTYHF